METYLYELPEENVVVLGAALRTQNVNGIMMTRRDRFPFFGHQLFPGVRTLTRITQAPNLRQRLRRCS